MLMLLMLQIGFYTQVLERSVASCEVTPAKDVAYIEEVLVIIEEGWALAELEWSAAKEVCQGLAQELDNLFAKNKELERKLPAIY